MKSILKRLRKYFGRVKWRNLASAPAEGAVLPPTPEQMPDMRSTSHDPYAEMRRVLATAMLLG